MIEHVKQFTEQCGLFAVWKRSGKQRLIVDARRSNRWLGPPPKTELATTGSFGRLDAIAGKDFELGQTDIQGAFSQLAMLRSFGTCSSWPQ